MKLRKIYIVSIPENADYAEWWYIVGLFSTREKAKRFIETHPIKKYEQHNGSMKPRTKYDKIKVLVVDKAPVLEKLNHDDYFGKDTYLSKEEKAKNRRSDREWEKKHTPYNELMTRLNAHIWLNSHHAKDDVKWFRDLKKDIKDLFDKNERAGKLTESEKVR